MINWDSPLWELQSIAPERERQIDHASESCSGKLRSGQKVEIPILVDPGNAWLTMLVYKLQVPVILSLRHTIKSGHKQKGR
jgi:hypothetical protein